jgi:Tol biopolymer transport system component/predicted Ser/Thr protein kinase
MIGRILGHYRIESKLGEGGMGVVYRAVDTHLDRPVAIKVLPPEAVADPERKRRFVQEAKAASALNHPNIIHIYDISTSDGIDYIAMEFVDGETLDRLIGRSGLALGEALRCALQVADALARAHGAGIVHRDLKPQNVMVTGDGHVKLLDFGLAKLMGPAEHETPPENPTLTAGTQKGTILGTVAYMSPEQAEGKPVDARSDIFSFGVMLYEMVTGRRPFQGESKLATMSAILTQNPPPARELNTALPLELDRLLTWSLRKDPNRRVQHMADLKLALEQLKEDTESGRVEAPAPRQPSRRRKLLLASALLVVAAAVAFLLFRDRSEPSLPTGTIQPLTSFAGYESGHTFSPDGSFFAYQYSTPERGADIFVLARGGGDPIQLTDHPADDFQPRWSPDGRHIAFLSDRGAGTSVYLVPPLKGPERRLTETRIPYLVRIADLFRALGTMPWSPDGKELLFSRLEPAGSYAIWKIHVETGQETRVTNPPPGADDSGGAWSFDGGSVAFSRRQGGRGSLWTMPARGGEPRAILSDQYSHLEPAWTRDGRRLVFTSNRAGPLNLWELELRSGRLRQLTTGGGDDRQGTPVPGGGLAYFTFLHQTDLYRLTLTTGAEERLTSHTRDNFSPRFSPDGSRILYHSNRTGNYEIWVLDPAGRTERQLTSHPAQDLEADWSPDGKEIAFISNREGPYHVWVVNPDGGAARRLTSQPTPMPGFGFMTRFVAPRWSPDGKRLGYIAQAERGAALWIGDRHGQNGRPRIAEVLHFDWSRDSRQILYTRMAADGSGYEMRILDLESGRDTAFRKGAHVELAVSPDGRFLAYCDAISHFSQSLSLLRLGPGPGDVRRLNSGQGQWHAHGPAWSPDGKSLVYTRDTDQGDIYLIQNYR